MIYFNYNLNKLLFEKLSKNILKKKNFILKDISKILDNLNIIIKILNIRYYLKFKFNFISI
jgi:hypothetical protein